MNLVATFRTYEVLLRQPGHVLDVGRHGVLGLALPLPNDALRQARKGGDERFDDVVGYLVHVQHGSDGEDDESGLRGRHELLQFLFGGEHVR